MDIDIGTVDGGISKGQTGYILPLFQLFDDCIGSSLVSCIQNGFVFCHGSGEVEAFLCVKILHNTTCNLVSDCFSFSVCRYSDDRTTFNRVYCKISHKTRISGSHTDTI